MRLLKHLLNRFRAYSPYEKKLSECVRRITGARPGNIDLYALAMKHTSAAAENSQGFRESNERLEYLGDAILGAIVAEYLFKRYPYKDEGFLTEIRSRIVNRESMNRLAINIGLIELIEFEGRRKGGHTHKSMYGDAMEAFFGALYLDQGFEFTRKFIIREILHQQFDLDEVVNTTINYKSKIIEWAQKNDRQIFFDISEHTHRNHNKQFKARLLIDEELLSEGWGLSKKKAEQDAARKAVESLSLDED